MSRFGVLVAMASMGIGCAEPKVDPDTATTDAGGPADTGSGSDGPFGFVLVSGGEFAGQFFASVSVVFFDVPWQTASTSTGTTLPLDTCEVYSGSTATATATPTTWPSTSTRWLLDPGDVTVEFDDVSVPIGPSGEAQLDEWPAGRSMSISTTGGDIPAFTALDFAALPDPLSPVTATGHPDGSTTVTWSGDPGGPDSVMWLSQLATDGGQACLVVDDGAFDMPDPGFDPYLVMAVRSEVTAAELPEVWLVGGGSYGASLVQ